MFKIKTAVRIGKKLNAEYPGLWIELAGFLKKKKDIMVSPIARRFIAKVGSQDEFDNIILDIKQFVKGKTNGDVKIMFRPRDKLLIIGKGKKKWP